MQKITYTLIVCWVVASAVILVKSYFHTYGYLTPDSCFYLGLAQNLIDGKGFSIASYTGEGERVWFSVWPAGYPVLIAGIAYVSGLTVFWSSKILNIILFGIAIFLVRSLFREKAYLLGVVLLFPPILEIFSYTWSETLFIVSMIWFAYAAVSFDAGENRFAFVHLVLASVLLFLSRYIGAFAAGLLCIGAIYYLIQKDYRRSVQLAAIFLLVSSLIAGYLYVNASLSGYATGTERIPAGEEFPDLAAMTVIAFVNEFNFLQGFLYSPDVLQVHRIRMLKIVFLVIQLIVLAYVIVRYELHKINRIPVNRTVLLLACIGIMYWISITVLRWNFHFDRLSFRLLAPGTLLVLFGLVVYVQNVYAEHAFSVIRKGLYFIAFLSVAGHTTMIAPYIIQKERQGYHTYAEELHNLYGQIPEGSVVIFPNYHSVYLRPDLIKAFPLANPHVREEWSDFIERILRNYPGKEMYVQIYENSFRPALYHPSVTEFMDGYSEKEFVKIQDGTMNR